MLRDTPQLQNTMPTRKRWALTGTLLLVGIVLAGLRLPGTENPSLAQAQEDTPSTTSTDSNQTATDISKTKSKGTVTAADPQPLSLAWVPRDAVTVLAVRPARTLQAPSLQKFKEGLKKHEIFKDLLGFPLAQMEQLTLVFLPETQDNNIIPEFAGTIIRTTQPIPQEEWLQTRSKEKLEKHQYGPYHYIGPKRAPYSPNRFFSVVDDRTAVMAQDETMIRRIFAAGPSGASRAPWSALWQKASGANLATFTATGRLQPTLEQEFERGRSPFPGMTPILKKTEQVVADITVDQNLKLQIHAKCTSPMDAENLEKKIPELVNQAKNLLSRFREQIAGNPNGQGLMALRAIDMADDALDRLKIEVDGDTVALRSQTQAEPATFFLANLLPAMTRARQAARRTQSKNNLKQIGLAFHNYHDTYGHFPPAVVTHRGNTKLEHPHSWRVAILPFVDAPGLYEKYRFDEPWDSDHNKQILQQMPPVFRHSNAPEDSKNACYFALTGEETLFDGGKGTPIQEIRDGTSNTIMVVEAKRDIPWTKPADIPYDPEKPLPELGGFHDEGFNAVFTDGHVQFIGKNVEDEIIRKLITKAGKEIVELP